MKSIESKVAFSFATISLTFLVMTVVTFIQVNKVKALSRHIQNVLEPSIEANLRMTNAINTSLVSIQGWILIEDDRFTLQRQAFSSVIDKNYNQLLNYSKRWEDVGQVDKLTKLSDNLALFKREQDRLERMVHSGERQEAIRLLKEQHFPLANQLVASLRRISDPQDWEMERTFRSEEELVNSMKNTAIAFLILSVIGGMSLGLLLLRAVIFPLQKTIKLAESVASGNYVLHNNTLSGEMKLDSALYEMTKQLEQKSQENHRQQAKLEEYNEELEVYNNELSQFSYRTSHDLKAPLITVRGLAKAIDEDIADGDYNEAADNAKKIAKHVKKLEDLVVDILNLAKAELKSESSEPVNVNELINDIKVRLNSVYIDNNIDIECDIDDSFVTYVSKVRLVQVLENLISNAIKYRDINKPTQYVKVSASKESGQYRFRIEDNGIGIPDDLKDRAFEMFQRFHPNVAYGSGLGLYIIKKHIEKMMGNISFTSSENGTTFIVEIPERTKNEKALNNDN